MPFVRFFFLVILTFTTFLLYDQLPLNIITEEIKRQQCPILSKNIQKICSLYFAKSLSITVSWLLQTEDFNVTPFIDEVTRAITNCNNQYIKVNTRSIYVIENLTARTNCGYNSITHSHQSRTRSPYYYSDHVIIIRSFIMLTYLLQHS
jgi:hypothetical protein